MRGEFDGLEHEKDNTEKQNKGKQLRSYIITFICMACAVYSLCGFYHQQKTGELFYYFAFDEDAKNNMQGATLDVSVEMFAKQHRNTETDHAKDSDWTSIVEEKVN